MIAVDRAASTIVRKLRISPNGKLLALGDDEGLVRIVRLETFEVIAALHAHSGRISDLDFSPDSRTLLSAGRDRLLRFWNLENMRPTPLRELKAPAAAPYSARMNPSLPDRFVLMGDREGRVMEAAHAPAYTRTLRQEPGASPVRRSARRASPIARTT